MKKITFDSLPDAITEILVRIEKIENMLGKKAAKAAKEMKARQPNKKAGKKATKKVKEQTKKVFREPAEKKDVDRIYFKEAVNFLHVSIPTLYSYVKNKKVPFEKEGKRLVFSKTALEKMRQVKKAGKTVRADIITAQDAQKLFKKPLPTIYYLIKTRNLQVVEKRGRTLYYSKKDFVKAFKVKSTRTKKIVEKPVTPNE